MDFYHSTISLPKFATDRRIEVRPIAIGGNIRLDDGLIRGQLGIQVVDVVKRRRFECHWDFGTSVFEQSVMAGDQMLELMSQ